MRPTPIGLLAIFTLLVFLWVQFAPVGDAAVALQGTTTPGAIATATAPPTVTAPAETPTPLTALPFPEDSTALIILSAVIVFALGGALLFSLRGRA